MLAEGAGLAYGLLLVAGACGSPGPLGVMGDNLPIVRLGACNSRIRTDAVWAEVEDALMLIASRRWQPRWLAVRRHLNRAADALATCGVFEALRSLDAGGGPDQVWLWCDSAAFRRRGWRVPAAIIGRPATAVHAATRPLSDLR